MTYGRFPGEECHNLALEDRIRREQETASSDFFVTINVMISFGKRHWGILLATILSLAAYGGLVQMDWLFGTLRDGHVPETITWFLLAFGAFLAAIVWVEKRPVPYRWLWGTAILFRFLLLLTTPTLSDDVYRYLWDGHLTTNGLSPYSYAIDDTELDYLDIPVRTQANHTWMASPYLPGAQLLFFGIAALFPLSPLFLQMAMVVFDLLTAWLISRLLEIAGLPRKRVLLYLWNPLVVVEAAHGGHVDVWMNLLVFGAIYFTFVDFRRLQDSANGRLARIYWPPLFLSLATLTKILPIMLFPILFWRWTWRQRIAYIIINSLFLVPFGIYSGWGLAGPLDGTGLFGALRVYGRQWNFNSGLFHWFEEYLQNQGAADPASLGKMVVVIIIGFLITSSFFLARGKNSLLPLIRLLVVPIAAYILLSPTMHPWYLLFLLVFLPFLSPAHHESWRTWLLAAPWLYLSGALIFSYLTYLDPQQFGELEWVRRLEWLPTLFLSGTAVLINFFQRQSESVNLRLR